MADTEISFSLPVNFKPFGFNFLGTDLKIGMRTAVKWSILRQNPRNQWVQMERIIGCKLYIQGAVCETRLKCFFLLSAA